MTTAMIGLPPFGTIWYDHDTATTWRVRMIARLSERGGGPEITLAYDFDLRSGFELLSAHEWSERVADGRYERLEA
jgi:hypothetical protein